MVGVRIGSFVVLAALTIEIIDLCLSPSFDALSFVLYFGPIAVAIFAAIAIWAGTTKVLRWPVGLLLVYLVVTFSIGASAFLRSEVRWRLARGIWKERVLELPELAGQAKHLDWDGWGFIGQDTEVYLVYDPTDQLIKTTDVNDRKHAPGLPCEVWQIRRLEPHWYNVVFYTDTSWESCP